MKFALFPEKTTSTKKLISPVHFLKGGVLSNAAIIISAFRSGVTTRLRTSPVFHCYVSLPEGTFNLIRSPNHNLFAFDSDHNHDLLFLTSCYIAKCIVRSTGYPLRISSNSLSFRIFCQFWALHLSIPEIKSLYKDFFYTFCLKMGEFSHSKDFPNPNSQSLPVVISVNR